MALRSMSFSSALTRAVPSQTYARPLASTLTLKQFQRYSTETGTASTGPALLQKLRGDLKTAMRAKDAPRLSVLRAIMSANLNASKTANPVKTDVQLVHLIRRIQSETKTAIKEAKEAGREDLAEKNQSEVDILEDMLSSSGVQSVTAEDIKKLVLEILPTIADKSKGMSVLMAEADKLLKGKDFDRKELAQAAKKALSS